MRMRPLGRTDIKVSVICLGTMTWGSRNTPEDAFAQMDMARQRGVNFMDAAEMYPVPPKEGTYGRTEEIIGTYFAARGTRDDWIVATKAVGPGPRFAYVRDGNPRFDRANLDAALDASLARLQTDRIDLYQLHWPERSTNFFGKLGYVHQPDAEEGTPLEEVLDVLDGYVRAGKIRAFGLSNDTPWGLHRFLHLAEVSGKARVASVQNPYSLLNRSYEVGMAEMSIREDCGLLPYSPLGMGVLSGKYVGGARPANARLTLHPDYGRYVAPHAESATERYVTLARDHGLDPAQMALSYVNDRPFVTSNIIGATSVEQLEINIASEQLHLSDEVLQDIEDIHTEFPYPAP